MGKLCVNKFEHNIHMSESENVKSLRKFRHPAIADHLRTAIQTGHFKVGDCLPTELELAMHYKTSRHSIRAALLLLSQQGLIARRKNAGTHVLSSTPSANFQMSYASMDDLASFGAAHSRVVQDISTISASPGLAALLACPVLQAWMCISSLRLDQNVEPIGWTDVYVSPFHSGLDDRVRAQPQVLVSTLLEMHYQQSIATVQQTVCAVTLANPIAKRLKVQAASPGLRVIRRYLNASGEAVEISVSFHPAEKFSIRTQLNRAGTEFGSHLNSQTG